jgi:drug/metabolite transporter (DMT)-like permease
LPDNQLLLAVVVVASTAFWPCSRWALKRKARPEVMGVIASVVTAVCVACICRAAGKPPASPPAVFYGVLTALFSTTGFYLIIFRCLTVGPSGPTVTMNNLGLLWPVALSLACAGGTARPSAFVYAGLVATVASLVCMAFNRADGAEARRAGRQWFKLVFLGWVLSGLSLTCQFLASARAPGMGFQFTCIVYTGVAFLLALRLLFMRVAAVAKEEVLAGLFNGVSFVVAVPLTQVLLARISAAIVFPVAVASPIVIMLLVGHFIYRERLNAAGWVASVLGVVGIVLLTAFA